MSDKKNPAPTATENLPQFDMNALEGLTDVAAKLPLYDGGDARTLALGTKGYPVHGLLLGTVDLPSTIKDEKTGIAKPWVAMVVELKQACPVKTGETDGTIRRFIAKPGERILVNVTKAFERFSKAADHPTHVVEAVIIPEVSRPKSNPAQRLWLYPTVKMGRLIPRGEKHLVSVDDFLPAGAEDGIPALPEHATA